MSITGASSWLRPTHTHMVWVQPSRFVHVGAKMDVYSPFGRRHTRWEAAFCCLPRIGNNRWFRLRSQRQTPRCRLLHTEGDASVDAGSTKVSSRRQTLCASWPFLPRKQRITSGSAARPRLLTRVSDAEYFLPRNRNSSKQAPAFNWNVPWCNSVILEYCNTISIPSRTTLIWHWQNTFKDTVAPSTRKIGCLSTLLHTVKRLSGSVVHSWSSWSHVSTVHKDTLHCLLP